MGNWSNGEVLGFDFETTGVDRFNDVPVSYALVTLLGGARVSTRAGLVNPGRTIPAGATEVHGITTDRACAEGMPLADAIDLVTEAVVTASRRDVPLVGMKLDYDLTILDTQSRRLGRGGLVDRGWCGPVLDAVVLDRHHDQYRQGSRTLGNLCAHYGWSSRMRTMPWPMRWRRPKFCSPWPTDSQSSGRRTRGRSMRRRSAGIASGPRAMTIGVWGVA
jgi:DNA polymerase-3 subunit epsilon